jgi:tRNA(Ile)-lysidine synthetase-like protein
MDITIKPGKYAAAVSGGVDSVVLLDLLNGLEGVDLVVAHFDHGIREDSANDRELVQKLAAQYGLPFEYAEGRLGSKASEATARTARYKFLEKVMKEHGAGAIITAHHEDDMLETAIINMLRGTGRKGLGALSSRSQLERPLLHVSKQEIISYAKAHNLEWHEDSTNQEEVYLRNYIRLRLLPKFDEQDKKKLLGLIDHAKVTNRQLDAILIQELNKHTDGKQLNRRWFNQLPHDVSLEVMAAWLRGQGVRSFDSKTLERLAVAAKTAPKGRQFDVINGTIIRVQKEVLALEALER